ncbi:unnamed protein product [Periconia digitata]|uniref:Uncharacterized protein n=1 Tax=Periconia digitata TaxID=1303443 RepID=A0A9W4UKU0_9PLEO|nr:unnamed protein product [Periconia digitata]
MAYLLLPTLLLLLSRTIASPNPINYSRQTPSCTPSSYTLPTYLYTSTSAYSSDSLQNPLLNLTFISSFPDSSSIADSATAGADCIASAVDRDTFPNEIECSTGRENLFIGLQGAIDEVGTGIKGFVMIHSWGCDGQTWMSTTPVTIPELHCESGDDEGVQCMTDAPVDIAPQNVRRVCAGPTC